MTTSHHFHLYSLVMDKPGQYEIRLRGHLGDDWGAWFGDLAVTLEDNGDTRLTGLVADQAALHGLLRKVRDVGLPLISVNRIQSDKTYP